jgi:DNA helicase-2/ATP-dependent DNA helicase PcrA
VKNRTIIFGPPGTGKTHTLLEKLDMHLDAGAAPDRIAFLTFTRRARREALERVERRFGLKPKDLPYFTTIHALAFKGMKLKEGDVLDKDSIGEFGGIIGMKFTETRFSERVSEGLNGESQEGDYYLSLIELARLQGVPLDVMWRKQTGVKPEWNKVDWFVRTYEAFKQDRGLLDFTDVLVEYAKKGTALELDAGFIDEAQDLSSLQWLVALQALEAAPDQYVAGDDDQSLFKWAGADVETFQSLPGTRLILTESYRIPRAVHRVASQIVERVSQRVVKEFKSRDEEGVLKHYSSVELLPLPKSGEQWLWLVRNRYMLNDLRDRLSNNGVVYAGSHGQSSIYPAERKAIYMWEKLRAGKAIEAEDIRDMFEKLRGGAQIKRGYKTLPNAYDKDLLTMLELQRDHGLLADGPWYEVFTTIPLGRRMYYRRLLRHHKTLNLEPCVQLETIHGAKGAQADHVALFLEQSRRTWAESQQGSSDDEHRVWYVGCTRARVSLHVVASSSRYAYPFPRESH